MNNLDVHRQELLLKFNAFADLIQDDLPWIYSALRAISPSATASDEITKTIRALRTYVKEVPLLAGRVPMGEVAVALPFNNPLYSFVLYSFGVVLGGSRVVVRPSGLTGQIVEDIHDRYRSVLDTLPIELATGSGADFLSGVCHSSSIRSLIFTGSYENLSTLEPRVPESKTLIYCGSGIDPFIVCSDAFSGKGGAARIAELAIRSKLHNSGQDCLCAERFYVHEDLLDLFVSELVSRVAALPVGSFEDEDAEIVPLMGDLAGRLAMLIAKEKNPLVHLAGTFDGALVHPYVLQVPIDSDLLTTEKFGPVFVMAKFRDNSDIDRALDVDYRFGLTVCGSYSSPILETYPHRTSSTSVLEAESEDAHVPFGGRLKSGFVRRGSQRSDGPILYSIETTQLQLDSS